MAKAKKRVAARKKSSKRGKASTKPASKMATKHPTPKKTKSKVQRAGVSTKKSPAKKKRPPETMERRPVAEMPVTTVETTIIDVIEEPAPGVVAVTEYDVAPTQPINSEGGHVGATDPGWIEFRPERQDQQHAHGPNPVHSPTERFQARRV